jgi:hypothetical protein
MNCCVRKVTSFQRNKIVLQGVIDLIIQACVVTIGGLNFFLRMDSISCYFLDLNCKNQIVAVRPFFLNEEGYGGGASYALLYYQITRPTNLSLASFNQVIGVVGSRFLCLITV